MVAGAYNRHYLLFSALALPPAYAWHCLLPQPDQAQAGSGIFLGPEPSSRAGSGKALMPPPIAVHLGPSQRRRRDSKPQDERAQAADAVGRRFDRGCGRTDQERTYDWRNARSSSMAQHLAHRRLILFIDVPTMAIRGSPLPGGRKILPI